MKILKILIFILLPILCFTQDLEQNANWKKYRKLTEINYEQKCKAEYYLDKGKLVSVKLFVKDSLTQTRINRQPEVIIKDSTLSDGEFYYYNGEGRLTEKVDFETG
jgi:hypothetical protein